jgi:hypothetical protein
MPDILRRRTKEQELALFFLARFARGMQSAWCDLGKVAYGPSRRDTAHQDGEGPKCRMSRRDLAHTACRKVSKSREAQ